MMQGQDPQLKAELKAYLEKSLPAQGQQPFRVLTRWPKDAASLPCISLTQGDGGLGKQTIGQGWSTDVEGPDGATYSVTGTYWRQSIHVDVWCTNPRQRDQMANAMRSILYSFLRWASEELDVQEASIQEQGDGEDLEGQAPKDVFTFGMTFAGLVPVTEIQPQVNLVGLGLVLEV